MSESMLNELESYVAAVENTANYDSDYAMGCGCTDNCQSSCSGSCEGGCDAGCLTTSG